MLSGPNGDTGQLAYTLEMKELEFSYRGPTNKEDRWKCMISRVSLVAESTASISEARLAQGVLDMAMAVQMEEGQNQNPQMNADEEIARAMSMMELDGGILWDLDGNQGYSGYTLSGYDTASSSSSSSSPSSSNPSPSSTNTSGVTHPPSRSRTTPTPYA